MALVLDDPKLEQLAREAASLEHADITQVLSRALNTYLSMRKSIAYSACLLEKIAANSHKKRFPEEIALTLQKARQITEVCAALPDLDTRNLDEILGYAANEQAACGYQPIADKKRTVADALEIVKRCAALPVLDRRSADEILGYNEYGTFD